VLPSRGAAGMDASAAANRDEMEISELSKKESLPTKIGSPFSSRRRHLERKVSNASGPFSVGCEEDAEDSAAAAPGGRGEKTF